MSQKDDDNADSGAEGAGPNPLDTWIKRELGDLYGDIDKELPGDIADLAKRLEEKLARRKSEKDG